MLNGMATYPAKTCSTAKTCSPPDLLQRAARLTTAGLPTYYSGTHPLIGHRSLTNFGELCSRSAYLSCRTTSGPAMPPKGQPPVIQPPRRGRPPAQSTNREAAMPTPFPVRNQSANRESAMPTPLPARDHSANRESANPLPVQPQGQPTPN